MLMLKDNFYLPEFSRITTNGHSLSCTDTHLLIFKYHTTAAVMAEALNNGFPLKKLTLDLRNPLHI